jgi:predicted transposase YdaD
MENQMPYVTSIERLAKLEGKLEGKLGGKIQLLQEILGVRVSSDNELEELSVEQLESLFGELRRQWNKENE